MAYIVVAYIVMAPGNSVVGMEVVCTVWHVLLT